MLGAAADDLYEMKDFRPAIAAAQRVIERYPARAPAIRRSAWTVVAHSSFELAEYPQAEQAYAQVLALTPQDDESRRRSSTTSPPRSTSRASRPTPRRTIARPPTTSCASPGGADVADPAAPSTTRRPR